MRAVPFSEQRRDLPVNVRMHRLRVRTHLVREKSPRGGCGRVSPFANVVVAQHSNAGRPDRGLPYDHIASLGLRVVVWCCIRGCPSPLCCAGGCPARLRRATAVCATPCHALGRLRGCAACALRCRRLGTLLRYRRRHLGRRELPFWRCCSHSTVVRRSWPQRLSCCLLAVLDLVRGLERVGDFAFLVDVLSQSQVPLLHLAQLRPDGGSSCRFRSASDT